MADTDLLRPRGVPYAAVVDATGTASGGTSSVAQLAAKGIRAICQVDATGLASSDGVSTVAVLASRGLLAFAAVDENGVSTDDAVSTADVIRRRGIRPMVPVNANGIAATGSATMLTLAQRGLDYFCPVDESGAAVDLTPVPPNTIRARAGIFTFTGETMTPIAGYAMTAQRGAFALAGQSVTLTPPAGAASTVWSGTDKGPDMLVSGTPVLTAATNATISQSEIVRATVGHSTGKYYFEYHADFINTFTSVGIANGAHALAGMFLGGDVNGMSWLPTAACYINLIPVTLQGFVVGNTLGLAFDFTNMKFWGRVNGGNWNNDILANQNPATNTGGRSLTTTASGVLAAGPYFPAFFDNNTTGQVTANFGQTAYGTAAPAGFGNW